LDFISPTIFNITSARKLTERLYQARSVAHLGMWSMLECESIKTVLSSNPKLVKTFGEPLMLQDEDSYSTWWEFVFFDGSRWLPFHLDESFRISSEPDVGTGMKKGFRPSNFAELVGAEFNRAASKTG
jgi:hypothetical protein